MIVFEDQFARLIETFPPLFDAKGDGYYASFNWGTEEVLASYLALKGKLSFPLIWLVEGEDTNDLREPSVKRKARIIILTESQAPNEFNPYHHQYDYQVILQPMLDRLLTALDQSGISRYDNQTFKTRRVKKYSLREEKKSLVFICNAIVLDAEITFSGVSSCLRTIKF